MKKIRYIPLTATPGKQSETYREILPRSPGLTGIVRCFWGSAVPYRKTWQEPAVTLVIPDTCVDIIYEIDHTANTVTGRFCGINDASFKARDGGEPGHLLSIFGIRFFSWEAAAFSEDSLKGTVNGCYDVRSRFCRLDRLLGQRLFETDSLEERSLLAEELLLGQVDSSRRHRVVDQAVEQILFQKGALSADRLARECFISSRQNAGRGEQIRLYGSVPPYAGIQALPYYGHSAGGHIWQKSVMMSEIYNTFSASAGKLILYQSFTKERSCHEIS